MSAARVIRRHNCPRTHPTFRAMARCLWPEARWVVGEGPYVTLRDCGGLTLLLHPNIEQAMRALRTIHPTGSAGRCEGNHDLAVLALDDA